MEEIYILPDGSNIDISDYSELERLTFLVKNPKAKKQKGATGSATAAPAKNKAQKKSTVSQSVDGSSAPKKFRLATEADLENQQNKGKRPPPSSQPRVPTEDYNYLYDLAKNKPKPSVLETQKVQLPGQRTSSKLKGKIGGSKEEIDDFVENFRDNPVTGEIGLDNQFKIQKAKEKIQLTDSELDNPYMYYSSVNQEQPDNFVKDNYDIAELEKTGFNIQNFDGFLNKKGYKADYLDKEAKGLFQGEGRGLSGYDIGLAKELAKKKLLTMYMEDMQQRDFTKQDLNQDIEIASGFRKEKQIAKNQLFDQQGMAKYVEKNFPIMTQTLKDRDKENAKLYQESKKGGSDFFSWETPGKMAKAGWNAVTDRIAQVSSTVYDVVGLDATAEGIRMLDEENKFVKPIDRGVSYASGKTVEYDGTKYIVDSKGEIYDADAKIRVTDLFDDNMHKKLIEESKYGSSDWIFSGQGAAVQTSGVMADMLLQAAAVSEVAAFGAIASASRAALVGTGRASKFTALLNDTSQLLRKVPLDRGVGYSMIAQGALGYSQGYEETLKAARDNGINDAQAFKLANAAAQRMAVLYSTTGVINPQVNVAENVFGSKNIIKKAIDQYMKVGEKGFVSYIDDIIKSTPRNLIEFAEEGGKEVIQENIQQVGEIGVNKMTNRDAGKKIMNDVMSGDDFMNTSILSFISSGLISKAKLPSFKRGDESFDDLRSLNTLAKNKKEFTKSIDDLVAKKVFTKEESDNLKSDVDVYSNNINKLMKTTPPDAAMPIMRELDKVTKLTDEKQTVDKAFHGQIDEKIEAIRGNINKIFYESELKVKNEAIEKAIKKGVAKGVSMKSLSTTQEVQSYLVNEVGMSEETAKVYSSQPGFALNSETLKKYSKDPNSISDKSQVIVVNESLTRDAGVIQHEFLHGVLQNTLKDSPEAQKLVGKALATEIRKMNDELILKGSNERTMPDWFIQRMDQYIKRDTKSRADAILEYKGKLADAKGDPSKIAAIEAKHQDKLAALEGVVWEEALTIYSDALRRGYVTYNESKFTKLGDVIRRVLQRLGIKDIKFNSGKDVYNFIKDYNNSVETGNWGKALTKMSNKGAEINIKLEGVKKVEPVKPKPELSTTEKFSLGEKKSSENIKRDVNKHYDKEKWSVGSTRGRDENPAIERVIQDILEEYDYIILGKAKTLRFDRLPGYEPLDMIAETRYELMPHVRNFNREFFQKREEYKKELQSKGLDPNSKEFKDKVEAQDEKGYKGKKGLVKENDDLNAWINSQLTNKMNAAIGSGNVVLEKFNQDIEDEMFKESKISDGFGGDDSYLRDEGDSVFETNDEFEAQQEKLAVLLRDPVFRFVDEKGVPVQIETIPFGGLYISSASDKEVPANVKLKTETDPVKIAELKKELKDLERGLELKEKKDITFEEKEELKKLQSFKSFDLSSGDVVNTFKALSTLDTPARMVVEDVAEEILRSPNIQTLEYRNFKEKLADRSKTMMKRITFEHGAGLESLMYNEWKLIYDVINHPMDPVTGQSSYASKKLPPTLKEFDDKGRLKKIGDITRVKFLQAYYKVEEAANIIKKYGGKNAKKELKQLEPEEVNKVTGERLSQNTHFDRRTALRELFGDVMVLQEARRLIRDPQFLERVAERQVNLYNDLKDDVIRAEVLKDLSRGKSDIVKFSLTENKENKEFLNKFPNLLKSKEYQTFKNSVGDIYHSGSEIEEYWNEHDIKVIWFSAGDSQREFGDGILYKSNMSDLPGSIVMPDWIGAGYEWNERFAEKFPKLLEVLLRDLHKKDKSGKTFEKYKEDLIEYNNGNTPVPDIFWLLEPRNIKYADKVILEYVKGYEEDPSGFLRYTEGGPDNPDGTLGDFTELMVIGPMQGYKMEKEVAERNFEPIKFSLAEKNILEKQKNEQEKKYGPLLKTGKALNTGIIDNVLFGYDSSPKFDDITKFSLTELINDSENLPFDIQQTDKKYTRNFRLPSGIKGQVSLNYKIKAMNYYSRALQYSDATDTAPGTKLHTLKDYEEVEKEVVTRIKDIIRLMSVYPDLHAKTNEFIIQDYKDSYIDAMIQKSIDAQDEGYISFWNQVKNDSDFRANDVMVKQSIQFQALESLVELVFDEYGSYHNGMELKDKDIDSSITPNGLIYNPFFTYLFLKDVLSSRYVTNLDTMSSERKTFKKSEYKTTLQPIDSYVSVVLDDVYENFSKVKVPIGMVYSLLNMQYGETFFKDWDEKRKKYKFNDTDIFKFDQSVNELDAYSLNRLAAKNTNKDGLWCTGVNFSDAKMQLANGDFFIAADKEYKPIVAVRLAEEEKPYGIGEVCGINDQQELSVADFPIVSEIFSKLNTERAEEFKKSIDIMYDMLTDSSKDYFKDYSEENKEKTLKIISGMTRGKFFRFAMNAGDKLKIKKEVRNQSGVDTVARTLSSIVEEEEYGGVINVNEETLDLLQNQVVLTENELGIMVEDYDFSVIEVNFVDSVVLRDTGQSVAMPFAFELPLLEEINVARFNDVTKFTAKQLKTGESLILKGWVDNPFEGGYLEIGDSVNFRVDVDVNLIEEGNAFTFSDKDIDFNNRIVSVQLFFDTDENILEENESNIDLSTIKNASDIFLRGLAHIIYLPDEINNLNLDRGTKAFMDPDFIVLGGTESIKSLQIQIPNSQDGYFDFNKITFENEDTSVDGAYFIINEKPSDKLIQDILKSEIFSISKEVIVLGNAFYRDADGIGQFEDVRIELKKPEQTKSDVIKFSLAEEENGKLSPFLKGLPFTKQWLVARDIEKAISKAKMSSSAQQTEIDKLNAKISKTTDPVKIKELKEKISELERFDKVTFKVPSKSELSDEAIAYFIISKVAEGYNDFEFRVKKNANGPLTKQVLDNLDFKSKKAAEIRKLNSNLEEGMNQIIEENTGVEAAETFSPETAKNLGKNIGKYDIFLPPEDEDFLGLLYTLASGRGKKGEEQMNFLKRALIEPYTDAMLKLMKARQVMYKDWRDLINKKHKGITKVLKTDSGYGGYLNDQAVRVYLWKRAGYDIPGLDKKDIFNLQEIVRKNPELRKFAEDVSLLSKQANGYIEPDSNWGFGSVVSDINNIISKSSRQKYLEPWTSNVEKVFSKDNLSKIEALYGRKYVIALKNTLDRMKTGTNRAEGSSDAFLNWLNGATAVTMFLNARSAVLQTIGAVNYINTGDNNIVKAGLALLNVPQYTKDFFTLWNSDYLKDRRSGLTTDVVEAELAQTMNDPRNKSMLDKFKAVNYLILKFGFNPTRYADSFAIAFGGAGFYRNRLNTYKKQGMAEEDAINKTLRDFYDVSEVSQQSADVSKISMNQASTKGRILLSFMNTPFQYSRLIKKSAIDIIKGRGSIENNLAKIVYYGAVQNILFNALQNALFAMFLDDEEDQKSGKFDTAKIRTINGALDTFVRGMGMKGVFLSTLKNALMKAYEKKKDPKGYGDVLAEIANLSPSIGIKVRALVKSYKAVTYNLGEIKYKGFSIDNSHAIEAATSLTSAMTNLPVDRLYMKIQNIGNALSDEFNTWQRIAFMFGYNEWNLNPGKTKQVNSNSSGGLKIPVLKTSELKQPGLKTP